MVLAKLTYCAAEASACTGMQVCRYAQETFDALCTCTFNPLFPGCSEVFLCWVGQCCHFDAVSVLWQVLHVVSYADSHLNSTIQQGWY